MFGKGRGGQRGGEVGGLGPCVWETAGSGADRPSHMSGECSEAVMAMLCVTIVRAMQCVTTSRAMQCVTTVIAMQCVVATAQQLSTGGQMA